MSLKIKIPGSKLKLNIGGNRNPSISSAGTPGTPATPAAPSSAVTPGGSKLHLKFKTSSQPSTPAPESVVQPKKTKTGRIPKPSAKLTESKKRVKEESDSDNEGSTIAVSAPQPKRIKLHTKSSGLTPSSAGPKTPAVTIKAKVKGQPPKRPLGEGYDSEASDREQDPFIEEEFVLRMVPGDDCEYLRNAIAEKKIGIPRGQGGADITMKFFHQDGRRAAVTIRGHIYAATLVDLPCVIEGMKSWDRRGWWKAADICQMLWVFKPVKTEEEAKTVSLPKEVDTTTFQYPHGLTPPMHFARKRRFRKRISRTAIEAVEDAVEKLLQDDAKAISTKFEILDPDGSRQGSRAFSAGDSEGGYEYSEDEDAEGEADDTGYFYTAHGNGIPADPFDEDMHAELAADLEAELENDMQQEQESLAAGTPSSALAITPSMMNGDDSPMVEEDADGEGEDSGDDSLEDDDDADEDEPAELDEAEKARLALIQSVKEDIADFEKQIEAKNRELAGTSNPILRKRIEEQIRKMKAELTLKFSSLPAESNMED